VNVFVSRTLDFRLAIPADSVAALRDLRDVEGYGDGPPNRNESIVRDAESGLAYVRLPLLLGAETDRAEGGFCGIFLKEGFGERAVLLGGKVVDSVDLEEGRLHPVPRPLAGSGFSALFSGLGFTDRAETAFFLLDVEGLLLRIRDGR